MGRLRAPAPHSWSPRTPSHRHRVTASPTRSPSGSHHHTHHRPHDRGLYHRALHLSGLVSTHAAPTHTDSCARPPTAAATTTAASAGPPPQPEPRQHGHTPATLRLLLTSALLPQLKPRQQRALPRSTSAPQPAKRADANHQQPVAPTVRRELGPPQRINSFGPLLRPSEGPHRPT